MSKPQFYSGRIDTTGAHLVSDEGWSAELVTSVGELLTMEAGLWVILYGERRKSVLWVAETYVQQELV